MMVLNKKDMREIERALGMILGSVNVEDEAKRMETVVDSLQMIDATFEGAEKRKEEEEKKFFEVLKKSCSTATFASAMKDDADRAFCAPEACSVRAEATSEVGV